MSQFNEAKNFFEINMVKDYHSPKMKKITEMEITFLKKYIPSLDSKILDVMCGYGRLANQLYKDGYKNIDGVDMGNFSYIDEEKLFNFYNFDFYNWNSSKTYDVCYSLYNSYPDYSSFLKTIEKMGNCLNENGTLIIDIFNKEWRDSLPSQSFRVVSDNEDERILLFREYDGINEKSLYRVKTGNSSLDYPFSQCVISKEKLLEIVPNCWDITISDSYSEKTREDNQKNILILRRKNK